MLNNNSNNNGSKRPKKTSRKKKAAVPDSLASHIYARGFVAGDFSDCELLVAGHSFALHRLLLAQSPFFAALFADAAEASLQAAGLSRAAIAAVLATFYGRNLDLSVSNVLAVLEVADLFQMPETMQQCVNWIRTNHFLAAPQNNGAILAFLRYLDDHPVAQWHQELADSCARFLSVEYPAQLCAVPPVECEELVADLTQLQIQERKQPYTQLLAELPFQWLKRLVGEFHDEKSAQFERYQYVKYVVEERNRLRPNEPQESVVVLFGKGSTGRVGQLDVVQVSQKKPPYMKLSSK